MLSLKRYLVNAVVDLLPPTRGFHFKRALWQLTGDIVGHGVKINAGAKVWGLGRVVIGDGSWLGLNLVVVVPTGASVNIGSNVDIGPDVLLACGTHDIGDPERRAGTGRVGSIEVGSGTWIGCRATLLGGTRIGSGSVIAAGAMVIAGDYPRDVLLAGVPARIVRHLSEPGERVP